ncbi:hypothetical protein [Candidatus Odyssella acanthamoebae]|uniref:Uncharacterized protein n=1 Tax=Candidatus Odyssella acanthamoebae TaxID=91604 RepID=A0A077AZX9_9PROT|nr:hypothetical protein [Candidatus Paracaedibacter acanthamoebae]AIK97263.1 hypothetical protein ID47_11755 [Candidatus Paracaedibacter acanthamoebae]
MRQPAKQLIRELFHANLIDEENYLLQFASNNKNRLHDYLNFFVNKQLLPLVTAKRILSKIQTEQPDAQEIEKYHLLRASQKEALDKIAHVNKIGQKQQVGTFILQQAKHVAQHYVGYTYGGHQYPIIGSYGAESCVIMAVHNAEAQASALCHIDIFTEISSLNKVFHNLQSQKSEALEVHLAGGDDYVIEMMLSILKLIEQQPNAIIKSANLVTNYANKLAIDSRTGEIYTSFDSPYLKHEEDYDLRMRLIALACVKSPPELAPGLDYICEIN